MGDAHIVLGMGYGDEGKGVFTDYLSSELDYPVVIRFNGGHQCGHTVQHVSGQFHVFSNFGAGSFREVPTFFSRFCTIDPVGMVREFRALQLLGVTPTLYVDPLAMVTTPFDKFYNINDRENLAHGTVGVGFGATVERNLSPYKLYAQDMFFPDIFLRKVEAVRDYYRARFKARGLESCLEALELEIMRIEPFLRDAGASCNMMRLLTEGELFSNGFRNYVFEGGQGILLDKEFGIFPNVTRSNTTSRNAFEILRRNGHSANTTIYYLTRAYQTRHGNGWMSAAQCPVTLVNNAHETNRAGGHQGEFRTGILDTDMLRYALQCDANFAGGSEKNMVVTCLDQLESYQYLASGLKVTAPDRTAFLQQIALTQGVYTNDSPRAETVKRWR